MQRSRLQAAPTPLIVLDQLLLAVESTCIVRGLLDESKRLFQDRMGFGVIGQQLNKGSHTVNIGFIGVFAVATDNLGFEFADRLVTVEGDLADGFF